MSAKVTATPLVIGDTVYAFTRRDGRETMTALDAGTGTVKWQTGYAAEYLAVPPRGGPWRRTEGNPALSAWHGVLPRHQRDPVGLRRGNRPAAVADRGPCRASVLQRRLVARRRERARVRPSGQLRPVDGVRCQHRRCPLAGHRRWLLASPILVTLAGTRQVVAVHQDSIIGVSVADGALLWRHPWRGGSGSTTPVQHADTIIVSGLDVGVTAIRPVRRDSGWIVETAWETTSVSLYVRHRRHHRRYALRPLASGPRPVLLRSMPRAARCCGSASRAKPTIPRW